MPKHWESALQLLLNLLIAHGGDPRVKLNTQLKSNSQQKHLPVIVLGDEILKLNNVGAIDGIRFSHGAFIECLQVLYKVGIYFVLRV